MLLYLLGLPRNGAAFSWQYQRIPTENRARISRFLRGAWPGWCLVHPGSKNNPLPCQPCRSLSLTPHVCLSLKRQPLTDPLSLRMIVPEGEGVGGEGSGTMRTTATDIAVDLPASSRRKNRTRLIPLVASYPPP